MKERKGNRREGKGKGDREKREETNEKGVEAVTPSRSEE